MIAGPRRAYSAAVEQLARIHQPRWIQRLLDGAHGSQFGRGAAGVEVRLLVQADAMLGRDAAAKGRHLGVHQLFDLEKVFAPDLDGQPLLSNNSNWINFLLVKNDNWSFENVVMIGDALHTAHFSIGSGTKLALEDAIALFDCFRKTGSVGDALRQFELTRKPVIEEYQAAALESMRWFENVRAYMHLSPIELAFALMTRSGKVDYEDLKGRDPVFISTYESGKGEGRRQ